MKMLSTAIALSVLSASLFFYSARLLSKTAQGKLAPSFSLKDETGTLRTLEEFKGKKVVLYFYPKDQTPGCTKEACSLRDSYADFAQHNIVILGISFDSPKSHMKFKEKYHLPFSLLSDSNKKVAKAYGATSWLFFVPKRKTFLIDENGMIVSEINDIDVTQHADQVLQAFGIKTK